MRLTSAAQTAPGTGSYQSDIARIFPSTWSNGTQRSYHYKPIPSPYYWHIAPLLSTSPRTSACRISRAPITDTRVPAMESLHNVAKMPTQDSARTDGMKRRTSKVPRPVPDLGGGSTEAVVQDEWHPAGQATHGGPKQFLRFVLFIIYFWTCCCSYVPVYPIHIFCSSIFIV